MTYRRLFLRPDPSTPDHVHIGLETPTGAIFFLSAPSLPRPRAEALLAKISAHSTVNPTHWSQTYG